jgi:hypothetical protein
MWGSLPFVDSLPDLSGHQRLPVLVVQGSRNAIIQVFATEELTKQFWQRLPENTAKLMVAGGTHSGFANQRKKRVLFPTRSNTVKQFKRQSIFYKRSNILVLYHTVLLDHGVRFKIDSDQSLSLGLLVKDENHVVQAVVRIFVTKAIFILQSRQHVDLFRNIVPW